MLMQHSLDLRQVAGLMSSVGSAQLCMRIVTLSPASSNVAVLGPSSCWPLACACELRHTCWNCIDSQAKGFKMHDRFQLRRWIRLCC